MQVEWKTIEAIAETKAIDLWLLFPLGIGVNRMLTKSGEIPEAWRQRLDLLLGTENWYDEFYRVESTPTLFGDARRQSDDGNDRTLLQRAPEDGVRGRCRGAEGATQLGELSALPALLRGRQQAGRPIALRIANHLLKKGVE